MNKLYPKHSFERFGDDLCELLLSYLSFDNKIRFECVSKQWKRLIFNKLFKFELIFSKFKNKLLFNALNNNSLNIKIFECLLRKCRFISELIIDNNYKCDENILNIICDYNKNNCFNYLKSINICLKEDISEEILLNFSQTYGQKLSHLSIGGVSDEKFSTILSFFGNNLKSIDLKHSLKSFFIHKQIVLPKLETLFITNCLSQDFNLFVDKYNKQLKKLSLHLTDNSNNNIKNSLKLVSLLENVEVLEIELDLLCLPPMDANEHQIIDESLKLIGQKCLNLYSIDVCIFGDLISDNLFKIFGKYFRGLKSLQIVLWDNDQNINQSFSFGTINCFDKSGEQLTKLSLMFTQLCDEHLKDIHLFLPNLTAIKLNTDQYLTDETLKHLSKLQHLRTLALEGNIDLNYLTIDGLFEFINSQSIRDIDIEFVNDLNEVSYDIFKVIAEMTPHINYFISFCDYQNRYKDVCIYINSRNNLHVYKC